MAEISENETIESLKEKIEQLQQFILNDHTPVINTSNDQHRIKSLELTVKSLNSELERTKKSFHNEELKNRLIFQQKIVDITNAKDHEISEYKKSLILLQSKYYSLQESMSEVRELYKTSFYYT